MPRIYLSSVIDLARASVAGATVAIVGRTKAALTH